MFKDKLRARWKNEVLRDDMDFPGFGKSGRVVGRCMNQMLELM